MQDPQSSTQGDNKSEVTWWHHRQNTIMEQPHWYGDKKGQSSLQRNLSACPKDIKASSYKTLIWPQIEYAATVGAHLYRPVSTELKLNRDVQHDSARMTTTKQAVSPQWFRIWGGKVFSYATSSVRQSWCTESSTTSSTFLPRSIWYIPAYQPEANSWHHTARWMPIRVLSSLQQYVSELPACLHGNSTIA